MALMGMKTSTLTIVVVLVSSLYIPAFASHNQCHPSPCGNGGICFINPTTRNFECRCSSGFTGPLCLDIDPCVPGACDNGGSCVPDPANQTQYTCNCLPGFTGLTCSNTVSHCASAPCVNGRCFELGTTFRCECIPGYAGNMCDIQVDMCGSSPCNTIDPKAVCMKEESSYKCQCSKDDYFGLNCEGDSNKCDHEEESYCVCIVNNLPVKFPLPTPEPYDGANTRDVIAGIIGILLGWLVGSALFAMYHWCFGEGCGYMTGRTPAWRKNKKEKPWERPSTASSLQTTSTGFGPDNKAHSTSHINPYIPSKSEASGPSQVTNIYRASFGDDMAHMISNRKSPSTYASGTRDW